MESDLTLDASIEPELSSIIPQQRQITIGDISDIEKELDMMEKVSLVYLLYDDIEIALQHLMQLQLGANLQVITEWSRHAEKMGCKWQSKLLEALAIIKNFFVINKLGYHKNEVCDRFLPTNLDTSLFVDLYKKKLYCICEKMTNAQMKMLLTHVQNDFKDKKLKYTDFPIPYMEMSLLDWTCIKYISSTDLSNLSKVFKVMEMYDVSESLIPKSQLLTNVDFSGSNNNNKTKNKEDGPYPSGLFYQDRTWTNNYENNCYQIDSNCPGICLIINQEIFYREPDFKRSHLLPNFVLANRKGTEFDRDKLSNTFRELGYIVEIKNNLIDDQILIAVTDTVEKIREHSSLIICILSHGCEGKVFGVNSISVDISKIRDIVCSVNTTHLRNKPKVLILQSCQGIECQTVSDDENDESIEEPSMQISSRVTYSQKQSKVQVDGESNLQMDGGSRPKTADVLLFWATVPGFGAVRDISQGSWFIQSLCKTIKERAHEIHFEDICTLVKQEVIDKRWKTKTESRAMVPNKESTLSRFFFLPSFRLSNPNIILNK